MDFRPISADVIERLRTHTDSLASATTPADALRAAFLAHCELREAVEMIPEQENQTSSLQETEPKQ